MNKFTRVRLEEIINKAFEIGFNKGYQSVINNDDLYSYKIEEMKKETVNNILVENRL